LLASGARAQTWHAFSLSKWERRIPHHEFEVDLDDVERSNRPVWLATRTDRVKGQPDRTSWADSETCPAMMPALAKLQLVEPFRIVPPAVRDGPSHIVLDGDAYQVQALGYWPHSHQGGVTLSGNDGTPVANWVEDTMKALGPCWSTHRSGD
jgi:hypothetical protein